MKTPVLTLLVLAILSASLFAQNVSRTCSTMENLDRLLAENPRLAVRMQAIEEQSGESAENGGANDGATVYTIPVVVHVVYNNAAENVSDAQIHSQIQSLTEDFRRTNPDAGNTPPIFQGVAADCEIEFCLATLDPSGNATNGITRTNTSFSSFSGNNDAMKFTATGGHDAWPAADYMNFWVCDLTGNLIGYAQFPGGPANTDGIVVDYETFGNIGSAVSPFDLGRTGTHEVGHWLNLRHIWGDGGCNVDDLVADTPMSDNANSGCPTNHVSCGSIDMVQNYMDYTDDPCMNIFTLGQKSRMRNLFNPGGPRHSLLNSPGCTPAVITTADFNASTNSGALPLNVNFTDASTGSPTSWNWDFGDGGLSNSPNPSHAYNSAGSFTVTLTISGPFGSDTEIKSDYITVSAIPGTGVTDGSFEGQTAGLAPTTPWTVTGSGHVINPAGGTTSDNGFASDGVKWADLSADSTDDATPPSNPGGISTAAVGGAGVSQSMSYAAGATMLRFTAAFIRAEPENSQFNDFMSVDITDGSTTRNLFYRDTFSPTPNTSSKHALAMTAAEAFTVDLAALFGSSTPSTVFTLTAVVGNGFDDMQPSRGYLDDVRLDAMPVAPPMADFIAVPTTALTGQPISFTNTSAGTYTSSSWQFGDFSTSTDANPTHAYQDAGTYSVSLIVSGPGGFSGSVQAGLHHGYGSAEPRRSVPLVSLIRNPARRGRRPGRRYRQIRRRNRYLFDVLRRQRRRPCRDERQRRARAPDRPDPVFDQFSHLRHPGTHRRPRRIDDGHRETT